MGEGEILSYNTEHLPGLNSILTITDKLNLGCYYTALCNSFKTDLLIAGFTAIINLVIKTPDCFAFLLVPCDAKFLRLPRLLKWHSVETFFLMSDYRTSKPNRLRAFKLILYLSVAMHWVACLYYTLSKYEGLGSNEWVYCETEKGGDSFTRFDFRFLVKYKIIIPPNIIGPILLLKTYE